MKRGGELPRRTPLAPGKPLPRATPLPAGGKTATPKKAKPGAAKAEAEARRLVYARSTGVCEIHLPGICLGRATNWHHRLGRSQGGLWQPSNGLHLCGSGTTGCHGAVTNTNGHRDEYEQYGWLLRHGQVPAEVPAVVWPTGLMYLADDGTWWQPNPDTIRTLTDARDTAEDAA